MYVHQHQLEHLLEPHHYIDAAQHQREWERLFLPSWHLVGTRQDLRRPGDFLTIDLFGRPVIVWNSGGEFHAFENICAHRHCHLTDQPCGNFPEKMRCQYHGWEYGPDGRTGKIPDARCFRPFDRENAHLRKYRTATCGELIFMSFADSGPSLREHLDPVFERAAAAFAPPFRQMWKHEFLYEANWKVPTENTLEMYHIPCLHEKTFGHYGPEEMYTHTLEDRYTCLDTREYLRFVTASQNWMLRRLGVKPSNTYTHHHTHPNTVFIFQDSMRMAEQFVPVSPTQSIQRVWFYGVVGRRKNPLAKLVGWVLRSIASRVTWRILNEDIPIFPQVQRGLAATSHRGVIGTLEERLNAFQQYILRECSDGVEQSEPEPELVG